MVIQRVGVNGMDSRKNLNALIGANIKRERENAGFTQDKFSELLGIGSKSLSSIERGVVGVSLPTLLKICEILHVSANVLLYEKTRQNDVDGIALMLKSLSDEQFKLASSVITDLFKAFSLGE